MSLGHAAYFLQHFDAHFAAGFLAAVFLTVAFFAVAFFAGAFFAGAFFAGAFFVVAFFAIIWPPIRKKRLVSKEHNTYL
jgi:predicted membrane protein